MSPLGSSCFFKKLVSKTRAYARRELELKTGESVVTEENFLDAPEKLKKKKKKLLEETSEIY